MLTITWKHILLHHDAELHTDDDAEGTFIAHIAGRNLRVTYYASRAFGPSYAWDIDDDDTGDAVASSRISTGPLRGDIEVDQEVIGELARELHDDCFNAE